MTKKILLILVVLFMLFNLTVKARTLEISAVGDIMLTRKVGKVCNGNLFYPFSLITHVLQRDLTFGNLETSISDRGSPLPGKGIWFRSHPRAAPALKQAGFDVLSLANNHILDYDTPALLDTIQLLKKHNIEPVGAGENLEKARQGQVFEINGYKIAFLAYTDFYDIYWSRKNPRMFTAQKDVSGASPLKPEYIEQDVKKYALISDHVLVSLHWGVEGASNPTPQQRELARNIIDWGASGVIGHHPHVLQGVEMYKNKPIFYSLGNFVFDQPWQQNRETMIGVIRFKGSEVSGIDIIPVIIENCRPKLAEDNTAEAVLSRFKGLCRELGSTVVVRDNIAQIAVENKPKGKLTK